MGLIKNPDGSITVSIPRGDEVYDASTGKLNSEFTYSEKEWSATVSKPVEGPSQTWGRAGWLNSLTLPAGLRDLVLQGDSELDISTALPNRPAVLKQLDEAAKELGDDAPPVTSTFGAVGMAAPAPEPDHPLGAPTAGAASPNAFKSPPNARNPRSAKESQEAYEQATEQRTGLSTEEREKRDQEAADRSRTRAELESVRSAVTQDDLEASGGDENKAAARAKQREEERQKATSARAREASAR